MVGAVDFAGEHVIVPVMPRQRQIVDVRLTRHEYHQFLCMSKEARYEFLDRRVREMESRA